MLCLYCVQCDLRCLPCVVHVCIAALCGARLLCYVVLRVDLSIAGQSPEEYKRDIEERKRILIRKVGQNMNGLSGKHVIRQNSKIEFSSVLCCHLTDSR